MTGVDGCEINPCYLSRGAIPANVPPVVHPRFGSSARGGGRLRRRVLRCRSCSGVGVRSSARRQWTCSATSPGSSTSDLPLPSWPVSGRGHPPGVFGGRGRERTRPAASAAGHIPVSLLSLSQVRVVVARSGVLNWLDAVTVGNFVRRKDLQSCSWSLWSSIRCLLHQSPDNSGSNLKSVFQCVWTFLE